MTMLAASRQRPEELSQDGGSAVSAYPNRVYRNEHLDNSPWYKLKHEPFGRQASASLPCPLAVAQL